jgi:hypothetical protein
MDFFNLFQESVVMIVDVREFDTFDLVSPVSVVGSDIRIVGVIVPMDRFLNLRIVVLHPIVYPAGIPRIRSGVGDDSRRVIPERVVVVE